MKLIVLGDTHGREEWKQIVEQEADADKIVFLGDYWDSFDIPFAKQRENFLEICQYKIQHPDKVVLLLGNHDFHYTRTGRVMDEEYSGFQSKYQYLITHELEANSELFQVVYKHGDYLMSHAGVTKTWLKATLMLQDEIAAEDIEQQLLHTFHRVDEYINTLYKKKPRLFSFSGRDAYGDDVTQGPFWVRPRSLNQDAIPAIHVVGHTRQKRIGVEATPLINGGSAYFIDVLEDNKKEYLVIKNGQASIGRITEP
jgi:predicted phosphodiesterase